jgi:hypothetical protein
MPRILFQAVKVFMPSPPYSRSKEFSRSGVLSAFYGTKLAIERQFLLPEDQSLSGAGTSLFATPRTDSTVEITILRTPARSPRSLSHPTTIDTRARQTPSRIAFNVPQ